MEEASEIIEQRHKGDGKPLSTLQFQLEMADRLMAAEKEQVDAIESIIHTERFPPLPKIIRYAPGLRYGGKVTKRWNRFFNAILPRYLDAASFLYEKTAGEEYDRKHKNLTPGKREWQYINETFPAMVGGVMAKVYVLIQELKVAMELDTKSEKEKAFFHAFNKQEKSRSPDPDFIDAYKMRGRKE